jgi:hypothetical protein
MAKPTLEEKRLQQIRMQLFGKESPSSINNNNSSKSPTKNESTKNTPPMSSSIQSSHNLGEARFLKQDITKVIILSSLAVGGQFLLHYLSLQGIVNLNVFHLF